MAGLRLCCFAVAEFIRYKNSLRMDAGYHKPCTISLLFAHKCPGIFETYQYGKFPEQYYFMHQGPFATDVSYLINMFQVIVTAVAVIALIKQLKTNAPSMQNS